MQKWEYIYLLAEVHEIVEPIFKKSKPKYSINGVEYLYENGDDCYTLVNRLGQEGWELVSDAQYGHLYFKRPIE